MKPELVQQALHLLKMESPRDVLVIAPELLKEFSAFFKSQAHVEMQHLAVDRFEDLPGELGRFDFVMVFNTLEHLAKRTAEQLVSRLRDLHARLLWVAVNDTDSRFNCDDAVAQGMRMVDPEKFASGELQWYEFSLKFYKPVPQWLNARDWANPSRWDKDRW